MTSTTTKKPKPATKKTAKVNQIEQKAFALVPALIEYAFDNVHIHQRPKDGYIHATEMCAAAEKEWSSYTRSQSGKAFIEELSIALETPEKDLTQTVQFGPSQMHGIWVHPSIAVNLGQWLSPRLAVSVSRWINEWVTGTVSGFMPPHVRQYMVNKTKIPPTHFSMLHEMYLGILATLEDAQVRIPPPIMRDISTGRTFAEFLEEIGLDVVDHPTYEHEFLNGRTVYASLYPVEHQNAFRKWLNAVWLPQKAMGYFGERMPAAVSHIKSLLPKSLHGGQSNDSTGSAQIQRIQTPYATIAKKEFSLEKRRLQYELLQIQHAVIHDGRRVAILFEGRDAAGKGATINQFTEALMPLHYQIVALSKPTEKESKNWFHRYEQHLPQPGQMVFFDRSWYNRALVEPTMGYCTKKQYQYFMNKVLSWEEKLVAGGLELIKFYLSVDSQTQLLRFSARLSDPLKFWKLTANDIKVRNKWEVFSLYKQQMFERTSSDKSPWVHLNSNSKKTSALTAMLYAVQRFGVRFKPLTGKLVEPSFDLKVQEVDFKDLTPEQYTVMMGLLDQRR